MENKTNNFVDRVCICQPRFWPTDAVLWFPQIECQFAMNCIINDETKFDYMMGNLVSGYRAEVKDLIVAPPSTKKFTKIKCELIKRHSCSQERRPGNRQREKNWGNASLSNFFDICVNSLVMLAPKHYFAHSCWTDFQSSCRECQRYTWNISSTKLLIQLMKFWKCHFNLISLPSFNPMSYSNYVRRHSNFPRRQN